MLVGVEDQPVGVDDDDHLGDALEQRPGIRQHARPVTVGTSPPICIFIHGAELWKLATALPGAQISSQRLR